MLRDAVQICRIYIIYMNIRIKHKRLLSVRDWVIIDSWHIQILQEHSCIQLWKCIGIDTIEHFLKKSSVIK